MSEPEVGEEMEKHDNGSGSGSEASNGFEVIDDLANEEAVVDSTSCDCCFKKCLESLKSNQCLMDILYWRSPAKTAVIFVTGLLILCCLNCCSFLSVVGYLGLATIVVATGTKYYCRFAKCSWYGSLSERDLTLKPEDVKAHVQRCVPHLNSMVAKAGRVLRFEDQFLTIKTVVALLALTFVGDWFDLLTLVTIDYVLVFTLPPIYERRREQIDAVLGNVCRIAKAKLQDVNDQVKKKLAKKQQ